RNRAQRAPLRPPRPPAPRPPFPLPLSPFPPPPRPAVAQSAAPPLQWAPCDDIPAVECAGIEVPVDHARPDGATFTLQLGRLPSTDPAQKRGSLLLIPGGPGPGIKIILVDYRPAPPRHQLAPHLHRVDLHPPR